MVPLNLTYLHCLRHSLFELLFNLYYTGQICECIEMDCLTSWNSSCPKRKQYFVWKIHCNHMRVHFWVRDVFFNRNLNIVSYIKMNQLSGKLNHHCSSTSSFLSEYKKLQHGKCLGTENKLVFDLIFFKCWLSEYQMKKRSDSKMLLKCVSFNGNISATGLLN